MKKIHLISFDIPYPANYGGVIVVYYQLKALQKAGVKVTLHTYQYGSRGEQKHLDEICEKVYYYPRNTGWKTAISSLPYIVNSRKSERLLERLLEDDYPIFFEGVHTTAWINHPDLKKRKKVVRMHNVEWQYYQSLQGLSNNPLRKYYYNTEAKRLKKYDAIILNHADAIFTISENDQSYYAAQHNHCQLMPALHGESFEENTGHGLYFLYHGKLSVEDNKKAALYLMKEVFAHSDAIFVVAGMDPDRELKELAKKLENVSIVANPSDQEMRKLIKDAQANILYTFQDNGLKLKLLHALHLGRHCIVNKYMVSNANNLSNLCKVGESAEDFRRLVKSLEKEPFAKEESDKRQRILTKEYDNDKNTAEALIFLKKLGFN